MNNKKTNLPIMGKNALLSKLKILKSCNEDAEIITKIVMEKFNNILNNYYRRSDHRATIRRKCLESDNNLSLDSFVVDITKELSRLDNDSSKSTSLQSSNATMRQASLDRKFVETHFDAAIFSPNAKNYSVATMKTMAEEQSSINSTQISSLLSKSSSEYNAFSRKTCCTSSPIREVPCKTELQHSARSNCRAEILINDAAIQHQIILQICKALNICLGCKEFDSSLEYIEAERILLLAIKKREAILKELVSIDYEDLHDEESSYLGEIELNNLVFDLELNETGFGGCQWFFTIVSCGTVVLASEAIKGDQIKGAEFKKSFKFQNLNTDFEIVLSIFSLSVQNVTNNYRTKFHIKDETTKCPTPNKLMRVRKSPVKQQKRYYSYARRNPSFVLCGTTTIRIADIKKSPPFKLSQIAKPKLKSVFKMDLLSNVEITGSHSGFLTLGSEAGGFATWNRRWCHLEGCALQYWNYPVEQEHAKPIGVIDLRFCVTSQICQADRELCARPRTLLLEIGRVSMPKDENTLTVECKTSCTITRHYLSADSFEEMARWKSVLNSIIGTLQNWNSMKCKFYFK